MSISIVVPRRGINDDNLGKKHALHKLITAATTDYVWLQDDDIVPPQSTPPLNADMIILPLKMDGGKTLLERLQKAEYAALQELTIRTAMQGHPILCSGANLIVRRDRWLESFPDLRPDIPSGDDMFLLESFKRRGLSITVADAPRFTAIVHPEPTLHSFLHQRMRWAGKAPHYRDSDIRCYGMLVLIANLLQIICPLIILIKFPFEYHLIKKRDPKVSLFTSILLELVYPWYMLLSLLGGLFSRRSW